MKFKPDQGCGHFKSILVIYTALACSFILETAGHILGVNPRDPRISNLDSTYALWPQPIKVYRESKLLTINPQTLEITANLQCDILEKAFARYANIIFSDESIRLDNFLPQIVKLNIIVTSKRCETYPDLESDETYKFYLANYFDPNFTDAFARSKIPQDTNDTPRDTDNNQASHSDYGIEIDEIYEARIKARSVWGALRGLETFSQLINRSPNNTYIMTKQRIMDGPRYKHRGLLLDTARHFITVPTIKKIMDGMSYNKLNVFHWHIVDDQSFPYQSLRFPELSAKGAYSPKHVYSRDDILELIEYARLRGIRVIPEFDTPGHTFSWGKSHPEILTPCYGDGKTPGTANIPYHRARENLNPLNPETYAFVHELFNEVGKLFPDKFFHAGMDEAFPDCWRSNPDINNLTTSAYFDPYRVAFDKYVQKTMNIINNIPKKAIVWEDPLEDGIKIPRDTIIQIWKNWGYLLAEKVPKYAAMGYKIIVSAPWYLDTEQTKEDWKRFYSQDLDSYLDSGSRTKSLSGSAIIGGEVCMWTEYVDDSTILGVIWPRAAAVAERLWSPKEVNNLSHAEYRLDEQRCRMIRRGITVRPIKPGYCGDEDLTHESQPKSFQNHIDKNQWIVLPS